MRHCCLTALARPFALGLTLIACQRPALAAGDGRLPVEGAPILYRVMGSGTATPVILLHGGPGYTGHYLEPLARALSTDRPAIVYDQLGTGRSDCITDTTLLTIDCFVCGSTRSDARSASIAFICTGIRGARCSRSSISPRSPYPYCSKRDTSSEPADHVWLPGSGWTDAPQDDARLHSAHCRCSRRPPAPRRHRSTRTPHSRT